MACAVRRQRSGGTDGHADPSRLDRRDEGLHAEDVHGPREIVGEHVQGHLGGNLRQALHQKVRCTHPHLERTEGMLDCLAAHAHRLRVLIETLLHSFKHVRRVRFQLPGLLKALKTGETIFIVEGPRKCGPLHEWGLCATCNMGGSSAASVWREHAKEFFLPIYSPPVVILPDNDAPGAKSAAIIADALASVGVAVQILDLPGLPVKGDLINWIDGGGTVSVV